MATRPQPNPEKLMLLLFPLITLSFFLLAVLAFTYLPQWLGPMLG